MTTRPSRFANRCPRASRRGSILVEFMLVFPAFLVLCLFAIEVSLMWADKHVMRLATYEAARVLAGADLPFYEDDGTRRDDPCAASGPMQAAYQAAVRRMAVVTMPFKLYLAKLKTGGFAGLAGATPSLPEFSRTPALRRLIERWPTAVAGTRVQCAFDPATGLVSVDLRYDRVPTTPVVDRIMWTLSLLQSQREEPADLDPLFLTVGRLPTMPPGLSELLGLLTGDGPDQIQSLVTTYVRLLTAASLAVPEALRTIPVHTTVSLARDAYRDGARADAGRIVEPRWDGRLRGAMRFDGDHRLWGWELSVPSSHLKAGGGLP